MNDDDVLGRLQAELGARVDVDPEALEACRTDRAGTLAKGRPIAIVRAETVEDVQATMRIATATRTPVVTRGAGSGLAGGAIAGEGEIVLSTACMRKVLEISADNQLCVVEPGILNGELNAILAEHGLWWPPDPASKDISSVGGNIAMNAGGLLCAKYGVTREAVLALKIVLADGELLEVGHRTVKGVTGLDLCALMIGSEGTLGVIVEATLKVRPAITGTVPTIGCYFPTIAAAAGAAAEVTRAGLRPAIMELLDDKMLRATSEFTGVDLASRGDAYLLVQTDGADALGEAERIAELARAAGAEVEVTTDPEAAASLVDVRRRGFPALEAMGGAMLVEDIAVPRDRMVEMFEIIDDISRRYEVFIPTPAHAGDGNLHPTFVFEGSADDVPERIWDAAAEMFTAALRLGGTLSGEHGIGVLKRRWLGDELGERQYVIQREIKRVFDPLGILNPGKVFADGPDPEPESAPLP
ncbi:putative FAD-linked oxidoreductase [Pseudoclavibacter triregionum]|nr:putative FAD-linked oxidoreductase [Pseudoclavibacter triregionum]